jgi:hypothetical protein
MLQPAVRRTWAPKGPTPIHYSWDRRDRLSVASALIVSPQRQRLRLSFAVFHHNIITDDLVPFVVALLSGCRHGLTLVLDRWSVHRAAVKRLRRRFPQRLEVEWLPAYAPELNPTEQVWNRTKYTDLANFIPDDAAHLRRAVRRSIRRTSGNQSLLCSFFNHAKLKL